MPKPRDTGRCHMCGHSLVGLAATGTCPECGTEYTEESARRLRPWPSALAVCCRLGWPLVGLLLAGLVLTAGSGVDQAEWAGSIIVYAMLVAIAVNSYFQIRSMLRASLPQQVRTRGPVAILRAIGTTICAISLLLLVGVPLAIGVGCLIVLSQS